MHQRFSESSFPDAFVRLVYQRTSGNPFFLVTIIEELIRQAVLVKEVEGWRLQKDVESMIADTPASIQRLIEGQLGALTPEDREVLEIASVAGAEFSAAALGGAQPVEVEQLDTRCSALARQEQFIRAQGVMTWPDGAAAGGYRFIHALYQQILYTGIPVSRRARLHQQIGERLEAAYGAQTREIAVELAEHFSQGRDSQRAVIYLRYAGEQAMQRSAYPEAMSHLTRGLTLLQALPETPERHQQELPLQSALGAASIVARGHGAPEVEAAYKRAHVLCQQLSDTQDVIPTLWGLWRFYISRSDLPQARQLGEELLGLAEQVDSRGVSTPRGIAVESGRPRCS